MSTVRLIVNPAASTVSDRVRDQVRAALASHSVTEVETKARNHARELARHAVADGVDAIAVLGGDGTVNEAANGLLDAVDDAPGGGDGEGGGGGRADGDDGSPPTTALAALPGGSTNVFIRTIGLPRKPAAAAAVVAAAIHRRSVRRIPVGRANGRAFLFHAGIGYDAAVVEQVERRSSLKRTLGQAVFVYAAFDTWFRHYDHANPQFHLESTDESGASDGPGVDGSFAICLITNPYTYFGPRPLNVAPGATGDSGLAAVTVRHLGVGSLLGVFGRALGSGEGVRRHPEVDVRRDRPRLVIRGYSPLPVQVDGDFLGRVDEVVLTSEPGRLPLIVP
ncbi:MAG: diacylglycerol kinase family protein [Acidimicrobiales bacterium]